MQKQFCVTAMDIGTRCVMGIYATFEQAREVAARMQSGSLAWAEARVERFENGKPTQMHFCLGGYGRGAVADCKHDAH